jgi:hypothetical protein
MCPPLFCLQCGCYCFSCCQTVNGVKSCRNNTAGKLEGAAHCLSSPHFLSVKAQPPQRVGIGRPPRCPGQGWRAPACLFACSPACRQPLPGLGGVPGV